jgi:serine/threonine-protein kinase
MAKRGLFDRFFGVEKPQRQPVTGFQAGWILQPEQLLVNNYKILGMIGSPGGMGQVFAAEDKSLKQKVAIKVPALSILYAEKGAESFLEEAQYAALLRPHRHIVLINVCLTDPQLTVPAPDGRSKIAIPFIVMEYLGGGDLAHRLKSGPLEIAEAVNLMDKICQAIDYAHNYEYERDGRQQRGIIHRDLKPQNICFDTKGRPVVVDFGLARVLEDPSTSGGIKGTPMYMAPEQWSPSRGIDHRTDIYALGIILFEMVTGRLPFIGSSIEEYLSLHLNEPPPDPRLLRPDLPLGLARAILRALEKDKQARFESAQEFASTVKEVLTDIPHGDPPTGWISVDPIIKDPEHLQGEEDSRILQ